MSRTLAALIVLLAWPVGLPAQELAELVRGDRIRVQSIPFSGLATFAQLRTDTIDIRIRDDSSRTIALRDLRRLDVSRGHRTTGERMVRGILVGGVIGGLLGVAAAAGDDGGSGFISDADVVGMLAFFGAAIGAFLEASSPGDIWIRVQLPTAGATAAR